MNIERGDIILLNMPFSQGGGSKVRAALVVQSDHNNSRLANTIVVTIIRNISRVSEPTQLLIDIATPAGQQSGLLANSAITCENLFTVNQQFMLRKLGNLPADLMRLVDECLKISVGIG